jgi:hypothetical protein
MDHYETMKKTLEEYGLEIGKSYRLESITIESDKPPIAVMRELDSDKGVMIPLVHNSVIEALGGFPMISPLRKLTVRA